jgi:hypothetical protein
VLAQQITEATRARDEHVDAAIQESALRPIAVAAVHRADAKAESLGERRELAADLFGQFARRGENQ